MTEKKGHFDKGRWVEEKDVVEEKTAGTGEESPGPEAGGESGSADDFDEKIAEIKSSVSKNLSDLFGIGKALVTTEKGREHLAKKVKKAEEKMEKTIEDIAGDFEKAIKK